MLKIKALLSKCWSEKKIQLKNTGVFSFFYEICNWFRKMCKAAAEERERYRKENNYIVADCDPKDERAMAKANLPIIWVMACPGTPITAIIHRIADIYSLYHLSIGSLLQRELTIDTKLDDEVQHLLHRGIAIPRSFIFEMIRNQMGNICRRKQHKGFILTDYPSTVSQAQDFYKFIGKPDFILYIKFSEELTRENLNIYLMFQVRASKVLRELQPDIHAVSFEQAKNFHREILQIDKLYHDRFKIIDASLPMDDMCEDIMTWVERALVLHHVTPPLFVPAPLLRHYEEKI